MKVRSRSAPPGRPEPVQGLAHDQRRPRSVEQQPESGRPALVVDLVCTDSLVPIYDGADGVLVHLSMGTPEAALTQARAAVEAVARTRPGRVVASTGGQVVTNRTREPCRALGAQAGCVIDQGASAQRLLGLSPRPVDGGSQPCQHEEEHAVVRDDGDARAGGYGTPAA